MPPEDVPAEDVPAEDVPPEDDALPAAHDAGLPHPPHPAPLDDDPPRREQTPAEHLWELHDRGYLDDETYAAEVRKLG